MNVLLTALCRRPLQAFSNVLRRMLEAAGRGMWTPDNDTLDQLRQLYSDMDDQLEGVVGATKK